MAEQEFVFGQELTLDRATAPGTSPMPTDIRGVVSEAPGVMRARGALASVLASALDAYSLVGYDDTGVASFYNPSNDDLAILIDSVLTNSAVPADTYPEPWHLPGAGVVYHDENHYLLQDRDGNIIDSQSAVADTGVASATAGSGDLEGATWDYLKVEFIYTPLGKFAVGSTVASLTTAAGEVINFASSAHTNGANYQVDYYLRPDDDTSPYVLACTLGAGENTTLSDFPIGLELEGGNSRSTTLVEGAFTGRTVLYRGRVYGTVRPSGIGAFTASASDSVQWAIDNWPSLNQLVVFSTSQYLNLIDVPNYIQMSIPGSNEVRGLQASEAGVFVFGENGASLIYGDPTLALTGRIENFGQRPVQAGLGHNDQQPPALLGGQAFHVWRGRVYAINAQGSQEISGRLYNADDEFVAVVADNVNKLLVCLTETKNVFIFDAVQRMWLGDSASDGLGAGAEDVEIIVPNATHGVVYVHFDPDGTETTEFQAYGTASFEDMVFDFDDFSMGDRFRRDLWVSLEVFIENPAGTPTVSFDTESGDSLTLGTVNGRRRDEGDLWDFVFPWGIACRMGDWALTIPSDGTTRAYLPWKFRYIDREDSRWGKDDEAP